jgi:hypothetical protein
MWRMTKQLGISRPIAVALVGVGGTGSEMLMH